MEIIKNGQIFFGKIKEKFMRLGFGYVPPTRKIDLSLSLMKNICVENVQHDMLITDTQFFMFR